MELKTLQDAFAYFADRQRCVDYYVAMRWPDGRVTCPTCGSENVTWLPTRSLFQCKGRHPKRQFSVKVGTLMEDSSIPLGQWLLISWMLGSCRNGISSYEVARTIGITQKSAWFMLHRLREGMQDESIKLFGVVEADEAYVGGAPKNRHLSAGKHKKEKTPVFGIVERNGRVITMVPKKASSKEILPVIRESVHPSSTIMTDASGIYEKVGKDYKHRVINHEQEFFKSGSVHTNTIENFWSCLKRMLKGTYIAVSPKHLAAYATEQAFRFNVRNGFTEQQRGIVMLNGIQGKRLTYAQLIAR